MVTVALLGVLNFPTFPKSAYLKVIEQTHLNSYSTVLNRRIQELANVELKLWDAVHEA